MENKQVLRPQENVLMMFNRYLDLAAKSEQEELLRKCRTLILDMKQAYLEIKPVCVDVEAVHAWWKVESDPNRNLYRRFLVLPVVDGSTHWLMSIAV